MTIQQTTTAIEDTAQTSGRKPLPHQTEMFKGYSIDQLRYMRAYTAARIDINRERVSQRVHGLMTKNNTPSGIMGKVMGAFSIIDIALIAWKVGSSAFKLFRKFKK